LSREVKAFGKTNRKRGKSLLPDSKEKKESQKPGGMIQTIERVAYKTNRTPKIG